MYKDAHCWLALISIQCVLGTGGVSLKFANSSACLTSSGVFVVHINDIHPMDQEFDMVRIIYSLIAVKILDLERQQ